jgi:hypothetical protein
MFISQCVILRDFSPEGSGVHNDTADEFRDATRRILRKLRMTPFFFR